MSSDPNLLFGVLAVRVNVVSRDGLIEALNTWALDKNRTLADILTEQAQLSADDRQRLDRLVGEHLAGHGGSAKRSADATASVEPVQPTRGGDTPDAALPHTTTEVQSRRNGAAAAAPGDPSAGAGGGCRYRVLRPHARGGLGEVFVAEDTELHRRVALKEIRGPHAHDPYSRRRFLLEAEVTGGLEHPGIVPVYGLGRHADGRPFYAMRFIQGDTLQEAIDRFHRNPPAGAGQRNLAFRDLLKRFVDVCNAMAYAHSRGVLHRDLKPGNVMLGKFGETLVVDWGLAKATGRPEAEGGEQALRPAFDGGVAQTQSGVAIGTPAYMSPEQAAGLLDVLGPASDVYSLGATLYTLLTGRAPFAGHTDEVLRQVARGELVPPRQARADVPAALDAVVRKSMARLPAGRYPDALALAADVEHYLADEPVSAYREPLPARLRRWGRKHRPLMAGLAALLVTAVAGLAVGLYFVNAEKVRADVDRDQAREARDLARNRFTLALDAFNELIHGIQDKLEDRPATQELRKELLTKAREGLGKLLVRAEQEGNPDSTRVWSHLRMGDVHLGLGEPSAAAAEYATGHELARRVAEADPDAVAAQRDLGAALVRLGDVTVQVGRMPDALGYYDRCLEVRAKRAAAEPANPDAQLDHGAAFYKIGELRQRAGELKEALASYRQSLKVLERLTEAEPDNAAAQRALSWSLHRIGDVLLVAGQPKEALASYQRCLKVRQGLAAAAPSQRPVAKRLERGDRPSRRHGNGPRRWGDRPGVLQACPRPPPKAVGRGPSKCPSPARPERLLQRPRPRSASLRPARGGRGAFPTGPGDRRAVGAGRPEEHADPGRPELPVRPPGFRRAPPRE